MRLQNKLARIACAVFNNGRAFKCVKADSPATLVAQSDRNLVFHSLNGASFTSVAELQEHIDTFNQIATPFAWHQRRFKNRRITQL